MSTLYIIATPIGNLEDMTLRAIRLLKEVDVVLCEDTRVTGKLLKHYEIDAKTYSFNSHASDAKFDKVIELLNEEKDIAIVSDAGTPTISDPGSKLVEFVQKESPDTKIVAVPGASALVASLSISGVPSSEFTFLGFLPHKKGRETLFKEIASSTRPYVFYESPHRLLKALKSLNEFSPEKNIVIAKEVTKIHESIHHGKAIDLYDFFDKNPDRLKGEFVIIVH